MGSFGFYSDPFTLCLLVSLVLVLGSEPTATPSCMALDIITLLSFLDSLASSFMYSSFGLLCCFFLLLSIFRDRSDLMLRVRLLSVSIPVIGLNRCLASFEEYDVRTLSFSPGLSDLEPPTSNPRVDFIEERYFCRCCKSDFWICSSHGDFSTFI